jgi:hypothetical protein
MRVFAIFLASIAAISAMNVGAQARRSSCGTRCLEARIADLQAQIAQLNASTVKTGQPVTINAPGGCLSWGGPTPGSVYWVQPPCNQSTWVIQTH